MFADALRLKCSNRGKNNKYAMQRADQFLCVQHSILVCVTAHQYFSMWLSQAGELALLPILFSSMNFYMFSIFIQVIDNNIKKTK